jgi:hypothetical protein
VTVRTNKHAITKNGWVHDQDNDKIIRKEGEEDILLAQEKGFNSYVKVDDSRCLAAQDWWKANKGTWQLVRNKWEQVFVLRTNLTLEEKVDNKPLYEHLFAKEFVGDEQTVNKTIDSFIR